MKKLQENEEVISKKTYPYRVYLEYKIEKVNSLIDYFDQDEETAGFDLPEMR